MLTPTALGLIKKKKKKRREREANYGTERIENGTVNDRWKGMSCYHRNEGLEVVAIRVWGFTPTIVCTRLVSCLLGVTGFALRVLLTEDQNNTRTNLSLSPLVKFGPIARLSNPVFLRQHVRVGFRCAHVYDHTYVNVIILK